MPDTFIPLSEVEWVEQLVCDRYKVKIPKFLANYHAWWDWWERCRFKSMEETLKKGTILFDVGAEHGWMSAIYAGFVGAENMCLFEPCPEVWPNIKATWEANKLEFPMMTACGFLGDVEHLSLSCNLSAWPEEAKADKLIENMKYRNIWGQGEDTPQSTIDKISVKPGAITIDVEGAELSVLRGAEETLRNVRPVVWVSLHEKAMAEFYQHTPAQLQEFMASCRYNGTFLGFDHEDHWLFTPR
jgi:FkbM family methyltransferase